VLTVRIATRSAPAAALRCGLGQSRLQQSFALKSLERIEDRAEGPFFPRGLLELALNGQARRVGLEVPYREQHKFFRSGKKFHDATSRDLYLFQIMEQMSPAC